MISKAFQDIVSQMSEVFPKKFGIADATGLVLASSGPEISEELAREFMDSINGEEKVFVREGYTLKLIEGKPYPEYMVYVEGTDEVARYCCNSVTVAANNVRRYYDEKYDKTIFMQNIIFDNMLAFDLHQKALELHVDVDAQRVVFFIKVLKKGEVGIYEVIRNMFPDKEKDFVINIDSNNIVLIKDLKEKHDAEYVNALANQIVDTIHSETMMSVLLGVSTVAENINFLNSAYKEAQVAIDVGKVFEPDKTIIHYENLGIGRLIYQLPTTLCEMFLQEVFKDGSIDNLDRETLLTIQCFFENNLNVSETSRKLFVHRNTLVYRLEKIRKLTGLDLREFDHAITFKVALMVRRYLSTKPSKY